MPRYINFLLFFILLYVHVIHTMIEKPKKENLLGILKNNRFPILSSSLLGLGTLYIVNTYLNKESNKKENNFISFIFDNKKKISGGIALITFSITKSIIKKEEAHVIQTQKILEENEENEEKKTKIEYPELKESQKQIEEKYIEKNLLKTIQNIQKPEEIPINQNLNEFEEYKKWLKKNIKNIKRNYNNTDITFDNFWNDNKKNCIKILKGIKYNINIDYFSKEIMNEFKRFTFTFNINKKYNNFKDDRFFIKKKT